MTSATLNEIKKELLHLPPEKVVEHCLRLIRYKKENKELLSYLLFEAQDEHAYIENVKKEIDEQFTTVPKTTIYLAKKTLRKILRNTNKYIKYSGSKQTEAELRLHFCKKLQESGISITRYSILNNMYEQQLVKINAAIAKLHEDLQYDYQKELEKL